jgi:hypothetical protein
MAGNVLKNRWVVAFCLVLLAGFLRFYKLGDWPFAGDELGTIGEERLLFESGPSIAESQASRLPRIIPLSYLVHHIGDSLFGRDEFGSRVLMAVFGTLGVGATFLLLDSLKGRATTLACALLLTLWPDHIFQSQQTRFYIIAAFFSGLAMLLGGLVVQRRSTLSAIIACFAIFAAILCHTLLAVLWGTIFVGILAGSYGEGRPFPKNVALVFLVAGILFGLFGLFYIRPLASGWNSEEGWGYSTLHSLEASVNSVGWPVFLLAGLGILLLLRDRSAQNWYWVVCALGWGAASAILPRVVVYHPGYAFPLASSVFVVAACAIGTIYDYLRTRGALIGAAWMVVACLSSLPGVVSHYQDGSRHDIRTAAEYVKKHARAGDRVAGHYMAWFAYYAGDCPAKICLQCDLARELEVCARDDKRLWVVVQSCRDGLPAGLERFLGAPFAHELTVRRTRFDYAEYRVDVFLFTPDAKSGLHGHQPADSDGPRPAMLEPAHNPRDVRAGNQP